MTEAEMNEHLQCAQDMLDTVIQQRDGANNSIAQLNARVKQLERKLAEAERKVAEMSAAVPDAAPLPPSNGHDAEAATH